MTVDWTQRPLAGHKFKSFSNCKVQHPRFYYTDTDTDTD